MYTLEGLPLDDPQGRWSLYARTGLRILPARQSIGAALPGRDGVVPSFGSAFEAGLVNIVLTVNRTTHAEVMESVEFLNGLFSQRHRLLSLVHDYGDGRQREAKIEVLSSVTPDKLMLDFVRLDYQCQVPGAFWRDLATADSSASVTSTTTTTVLSSMAGTTGTINDALIRFTGGFSTATIADPVSGDQLTVGPVADGEYLLVDAANWTARRHTADSWSTTLGTNAISSVTSNRGSGPMFTLNPDFSTGAGRIRVQTFGVNVAGSPTVEVRAKRSFL